MSLPPKPGQTIRQTYDSPIAFPTELDESAFHVYARTGAVGTSAARFVDLGPIG